jgi:diaminohydroxyphosphoribosylaminopyrimidine deaminase/5-amino-6-(5-phosphoribosylamino)uracil reductase
LEKLYQEKINSLIVEGGAKLLSAFIKQNLWDEARIFTAPVYLKKGIKSPQLSAYTPLKVSDILGDKLTIMKFQH